MASIGKSLLEKYINGDCTEAEEEKIHRWLELNDATDYPDLLSREKYHRKEKKIWERMERNVDGITLLSDRNRKPHGKLLGYAAAIIILATIIWGLNEYTNGAIWWKGERYRTEYGETRQIVLEDGSVISLNAMSELKVPEDYGERVRALYLKGEAFFEVKKDSAHAFVVYSKDWSTKALGTAFNVSAYPGDKQTVVSLREGKVLVQALNKPVRDAAQLLLNPGEEAICIEDRELRKQSFSEKVRLSWKNQVLFFADARLEEVINKLKRFYGVDFDYEALKNEQWQLNGEYKQATLRDVLESLSFNYGISYEINGNLVVLK